MRASDARRQDLAMKFSDLVDSLSNRGKYPSGNWLSVVRNDVNYKSLHGVWFPFEKGTPEFLNLMNLARNWRKCETPYENPVTITEDKRRFFVTAFVIIDLALSIALDYVDLIGKSGRRTNEFIRLLNLSAAANRGF